MRTRSVEDAVDLATLVGDPSSIDAAVGVFATARSRSDPVDSKLLQGEAQGLSRDDADSLIAFLHSRGYASDEGSDVISGGQDLDRSLDLLIETRRVHETMEYTLSTRTRQEFELVCTLPSRDPAFDGRDPVDYEMGQITTRLLELCGRAEEHLLLTSPFLERGGVDWLLPGLEGALERGVDVTLVSRELEAGGANLKALSQLLDRARQSENGSLSVYDYYEGGQGDEPPVYTLHSKLLVVDRSAAYVGSANFTSYGFGENLEIGVVVRGDTVSELCRLVDAVVEGSAKLVEDTG